MKIGIDVDDTLTNTFDYLMPYIAEFFDLDLDYLKKNDISYSNLPEDKKVRYIDFARRYYDEVVPDVPYKDGVKEIIKKIKDLGCKIIIITARNNTKYSDAYKTTSESLDKNGIVFDKLICDPDKARVCKEENIDLFIDDSIKNCMSVRSEGIETLLFNSKDNIMFETDLRRVNDWNEIYNIIKSRM